MKIYFAGSIRGGRGDSELYGNIIKLLSKFGTVLTEHVADKSLTMMGETTLPSEEICERDKEWIKEADVIIAEITTASLGVGYEIGFGESLEKPILCLYREQPDRRPSAMICGNKNLTFKTYKELSEIEPLLEDFLKRYNTEHGNHSKN